MCVIMSGRNICWPPILLKMIDALCIYTPLFKLPRIKV